jgi:hypothetical protein
MKRTLNYLLGLVALFGMATLMSCEGPEGPAGADGIDGTDGALACKACHLKFDAIDVAFAEHKHFNGDSWARGTSAGCAPCHDGDAIVTYLNTGALVAGYGVELECGSCHDDHTSLEDDIAAPLRAVGNVASMAVEGATYMHGDGNLCATCHQARRIASDYDNQTEAMTYERKFTGDDIAVYQNAAVGPNGTIELVGDTLFVTFDVPTDYVYTSSTHAGPHHGPQANMFAADMGSVTGSPFERDLHTDCTGCHLNDTSAVSGYGHNFTPDVARCDACHGDALDITADMAEVQTRMDAIAAALEDIHAIHIEEDGIHPLYASLPRAEWNAFWDFMCIYEDKSNGVHNPSYVNQLLNACESALGL